MLTTEPNMDSTLPQAINISNDEFLQGIFGDYYKAAHVTGFAEDPGKLDQLDLRHYWGGNIWGIFPADNPQHNNFFTISTFNVDSDGSHRRRKNNFAAGWCIMIDDIGTGPGAKISPAQMEFIGPAPSWKLLTSPDNYQYGYIFDEPVMQRGTIEAILKALVRLDLIEDGSDPGMLGCTRYARLPVGSNTKEKYGFHFTHELHEWHPERKYSVEQLTTDFGITLSSHIEQDEYPDALPLDQDLIYQSLQRLDLIKTQLRDNVWDITCPWQAQHTELLDNGTAYLAPMGFKCHHGHCGSRTARDLLNYLHGADPVYREAIAKKLPFEAAAQPDIEATYTRVDEPMSESEAEFLKVFSAALKMIIPGAPRTSDAAYRALAMYWTHLSPEEKDIYTRQIKTEAAVTIAVVRAQVKHTRGLILKEHRAKGMLQEPMWKEVREDKIIGCIENFRAMCEFHGITIRYNQMSHTIECDFPGYDFSGEDQDNRNLTHMRDLIQKYEINYTRVDEWMVGLGHENAYHPFLEYLDRIDNGSFNPETPMFYKLLDTLSVEEHPEEAEQFLRRWLISNVAAVRGHGGAGMKGVLTFAGKQGIGKTSWFRELYPENTFCEGLVLDPHNKDSIIKATSYLVCELGELDATFKKDIPALKGFITNQFDQVRHPYAAKSSSHPRRTVFCATVNQHNFLVDQTGNSRFWPVSVADCNFLAVREMAAAGQIDELWREIDGMYHACINGANQFRWWIAAEESGLLSEASERFIRETAGESMLKEVFDMEGPVMQWMTGAEICTAVGLTTRDFSFIARKAEILETVRRITGQSIIKKFTRDGERLSGYMMPQRILRKMPAELKVVPTAPSGAAAEFDFL